MTEDEKELFRRMDKLRKRFAKAFENETGLRLSADDMSLLNLTFISDWSSADESLLTS